MLQWFLFALLCPPTCVDMVLDFMRLQVPAYCWDSPHQGTTQFPPCNADQGVRPCCKGRFQNTQNGISQLRSKPSFDTTTGKRSRWLVPTHDVLSQRLFVFHVWLLGCSSVQLATSTRLEEYVFLLKTNNFSTLDLLLQVCCCSESVKSRHLYISAPETPFRRFVHARVCSRRHGEEGWVFARTPLARSMRPLCVMHPSPIGVLFGG